MPPHGRTQLILAHAPEAGLTCINASRLGGNANSHCKGLRAGVPLQGTASTCACGTPDEAELRQRSRKCTRS